MYFRVFTYLLLLPLFSNAQVFISEFHYDDKNGGVNEFVEVTGPEGTDLSDYRLVLYDGDDGMSYADFTLSGIIPDERNSSGAVAFTTTLQNGLSDGIALVFDNGTVEQLVELLSYEGTFTAVGGPADGVLSSNAGSESSAITEPGTSIQRIGTCTENEIMNCPAGLFFIGNNTNAGPMESPGMLNSDLVLPIELSYFRGKQVNQTIELHWETLSEQNNSSVVVERSFDGKNFKELATIDGAGNSLVVLQYFWIDQLPNTGTNYYRLRQIDFDGSEHLHPIIAVDFNDKSSATIQIFPNPVSDLLFLSTTGEMSISRLQVFDESGKLIANYDDALLSTIDVSVWETGVYSLQLTIDGKVVSQRVIKE
ncbi:MAG: T9SS type A sorting domain-containing protein [Bacteroidota bacterium]